MKITAHFSMEAVGGVMPPEFVFDGVSVMKIHGYCLGQEEGNVYNI